MTTMKTRFYRFLVRYRLEAAASIARELGCSLSRKEIEARQTASFNKIWQTAFANVPFYRDWKNRFRLPDRVESLSELSAWPILTKADLRNIEQFTRADVAKPSGSLMTGGSTGEPVRLPSWEDAMAGVSQLLGRRAYGIEPGDRTVLLWGHWHLYGKGWHRKINTLKRCFKDWLAGWTRISAYDLSAPAMRRAYVLVSRSQAKFIIGFSPAVLAFVRQNAVYAHKIDSVKVILCTAGPLSDSEKEEIVDFFTPEGAMCRPKLCMEYGSVECGVMAYTRPSDGEYNVFWNTHLLQAQKQPDGEYKNLVTRLTDCYVPLIRYDIGDYLDLDPNEEKQNERSVLEVKRVKGRPSEMLKFKCGVSFFGALIGDCVKQVPEMISSQVAVDEANDTMEIRVTANHRLSDSDLSLIRNRFYSVVSDAQELNVRVTQVERLYTTVGGKVPRVVQLALL